MLGALVGEYQTCYTSTSTSFCKRACFVDATLIDDMMYLFMCFSFGELFRIGPGTWIKKVDRVNFDLTLTLNQFNDDSSWSERTNWP